MQRMIDGPDQVWSTLEEARKWLGLTEEEFRNEVRRHPEILSPNTRHKKHYWHWLDLVYFASVAMRLTRKNADDSEENNS